LIEAHKLLENATTLSQFQESSDAIADAAHAYWNLQIYCPFLVGGECPIYPVRPWACASLFSITPCEWCSPEGQHEPTVLRVNSTAEMLAADSDFYDARYKVNYIGATAHLVYMPMTRAVLFISDYVPRLENLKGEVLRDPEIGAIIARHSQRIARNS
jgi:Fe-S-cluster containining protein